MVLKVVLVAVACTTMVALADTLPVYQPPQPYPPPPPPPPATAVPKYDYQYGVNDPYNRVNFRVNEQRNGDNTEGGYVVDLSDGRTQIFNYVDNGDGLHAVVKYEGEVTTTPASDTTTTTPSPPLPYYQPRPT